MGLLFWKKKKVPKVPFPQGKVVEADNQALNFPVKKPSEKSFQPEELKEAVGFDKPVAFPDEVQAPPQEEIVQVDEGEMPPSPTELPTTPGQEPLEFKTTPGREELYAKVDVYQRIIGEVDLLRKNLLELNEVNKDLESSEYNEGKHFNKLRKLMKGLHDNLLDVDKNLFKF